MQQTVGKVIFLDMFEWPEAKVNTLRNFRIILISEEEEEEEKKQTTSFIWYVKFDSDPDLGFNLVSGNWVKKKKLFVYWGSTLSDVH